MHRAQGIYVLFQVVQMVSMSGGPQELAPPHQLRALNNYLLNLETDPPPTTLPPFSMVSRIGILFQAAMWTALK